MTLKTEYPYNEDDFVQRGSYLDELTVTVTLCEYRNLVRQSAWDEKEIEKLQEENERLHEQIKLLEKTEMVVPLEILRSICNGGADEVEMPE